MVDRGSCNAAGYVMLWNSFKINVYRAVSIELWTVVFFNSNMRQRVNIIRICNFRFRFQLRDTFDRFTNTMENGRVSKANTKPGSTPLCFITDRNIERINSRILESSRCITFRKHSSHYQHTHFAPASRHTHSEHVRRILAERARWWWLQTISLEQLARNKEPPSSPPPVTALGRWWPPTQHRRPYLSLGAGAGASCAGSRRCFPSSAPVVSIVSRCCLLVVGCCLPATMAVQGRSRIGRFSHGNLSGSSDNDRCFRANPVVELRR